VQLSSAGAPACSWRFAASRLPWTAVSTDSAPLDSSDADAAIVARMARGDRAAVAELYELHAARLLALAQSLLRSAAEAEDLIHDVFLEAWRRAADYSAERGSVRTWLLLRTRSRCFDRLKSRRRATLTDAPEAHAPVALAPAHDGDKSRLHQILSSIPEPQQEVILLGYFEGLSTTEIALRLGIPAGTVKSRTRAALISLRTVLGDEGG
jgi:RNA polymerase sigma-70 factor (ECF subfamily)